MNILLINHYAGSESHGMEYRPFYFAKEWKRLGHHTTIVAGSYSHIRTHNPVIKDKYTWTEVDGIEYLWVKTPAYASNSVKRFLNMLKFVQRLRCLKRIILKKNNYDVVIASSTYPLDIFPAYRIAKKSGATLIFEMHDLWPLSPMELGGYSKWHPFILLMQYAENFAYKKSHKVVSLLPATKSHMIAHGLKAEKWSCIPNGINKEDWENSGKIPEETSKALLSVLNTYKHSVAYTGTIGLANALESFIDAAKLFTDKSVAFILFGKGPFKEKLLEKVKREAVGNVYFFDNVPKKTIPHLLTFFDILYIGLQNQPLFRFGISPNKLMDYMMSGKPVIQAINAGNDMVIDAGCGISVEPENPEAIANAVRKIIGMSEHEISQLGENGKKYILLHHTYQMLAEKFINVIKEI